MARRRRRLTLNLEGVSQSPYRACASGLGEVMRFAVAGAIVAAVSLGAAAHAQTPENLPPPPPQVILPDFIWEFPLEIEGAIKLPDPRIVSRPVFDAERSPHPVYPEDARRAYEKGEVTLGVCVSDTGAVTKSIVFKSSGYDRLDAASLEWINSAIFQPARTDEGPVAICGHYLSYVWKLEGPAFPPFTPLANAAAFGFRPDTMSYEEPALPMLDDLDGVEPPKLKSAPALPTYPPQHGAKPRPSTVKLCIAPQGRAITVSDLGELHPLAGSFAMLWFNAMRFEPAKKDGEAIGVCGFEVELRWR
jgi:TonB family protein